MRPLGTAKVNGDGRYQILMSFFGNCHPVLVHFPIALVLAAAAGELAVIVTRRQTWRTVAVANIRAGAAMGIVTAITGWLFASSPLVGASPSLEWHRWMGMAAATGAIGGGSGAGEGAVGGVVC